jgi:hypothetical protein
LEVLGGGGQNLQTLSLETGPGIARSPVSLPGTGVHQQKGSSGHGAM